MRQRIRVRARTQPATPLAGSRPPTELGIAPQPLHHILQLQKLLGNRRVAKLLVQRDYDSAVKAEKAKKAQQCLTQKDDILPPIGLVAGIDREQILIDTLGAEFGPLKQKIQASPDARKFVCEAGVPAVLALWDTRSAADVIDVGKARSSLAADSAKVYSKDLDTSWLRRRRPVRAEAELTDVASWVKSEETSTHLPRFLIPSLPVPQRDNLRGAAAEIEALAPVFEKATKEFAAAAITAFQLRERLDDAKTEAVKAKNPDYMGGPGDALEKADQIAGKLQQELETVHAGIEVGPLRKTAAEAADAVRKLHKAGRTADSDTIRGVRDVVNDLRKKIVDGSTSVTDLGGAARRVPPVLRYFAALNTPGFAGAPDPQAVNAMIGQIDSLGGDLELLFGAHGLVELDFFREIALQMRAQMKERKKIGAAIGHETALVPERADVLTYFTSLAKKNNDEVIAAYTSYAETFFQHRIVERPEDLEVHGLEEIFARPLSVAGMRPLVCTGYAMLGSNLLNATGGATSTFIIAVRASDDQIRNGALDDGHAVAVVSRKGQTLYVSNHLVVKNKDDAIGPDAVAWTHKNFPLITATGSTVQDAIRALGREIDKRARKLTTP